MTAPFSTMIRSRTQGASHTHAPVQAVVTDQALLREMEEETLHMMSQLPAYQGFYQAVTAQSLGVASHIIAINEVAFQGDKGDYFKEKLHFPEGYEFGLAVLLGYAAAPKAPHQPDLEKIIYVE